jgi:NhaP-type Na+/H+ or K+/H+ antiporter
MKLIGKPFGYVLWGVFAGTGLGIASGDLTSPHFPIDGIMGAVLGAFVGYGIERYASRATVKSGRQRLWKRCLIFVVVPAFLYITIGAITFLMWFPQQARE